MIVSEASDQQPPFLITRVLQTSLSSAKWRCDLNRYREQSIHETLGRDHAGPLAPSDDFELIHAFEAFVIKSGAYLVLQIKSCMLLIAKIYVQYSQVSVCALVCV